MNVISAWSTTFRLIVAEVDFERAQLILRVADPIQLNRFSVNTAEMETMLGWVLHKPKGDLKRLHRSDKEEPSEQMQALSIQSPANSPVTSPVTSPAAGDDSPSRFR